MTLPSGAALVIGGAGRTGRRVASRLRDRGVAVRIMSRHPDRVVVGGVEQVRGDLTALAGGVLEGVGGVVVTVEPPYDATGAQALMHHGVADLATAAARRQVPVVLVSQIYITRPNAYAQMREIIVARGQGEQKLRDSGAPYVIVRPGWLTGGPPTGARLEQGDTGDGPLSRDTLADACVNALLTPQASGRTFELFDSDVQPPQAIDWPRALSDLTPDSRRDRAR